MEITSILSQLEERSRVSETDSKDTDGQPNVLSLLSLIYMSTAAVNANAIAATSSATASLASAASAPKGSSPAGDFPIPYGDTNPPLVPDPSVPSGSDVDGVPYYIEKLNKMIEAMMQEPDNMAQGQIFLQYIKNLSAAGLMKDPQVQNCLKSMDVETVINRLITQNAELAYFEGYDGKTGIDAANQWIADQAADITNIVKDPSHDNPVLDIFSNQLGIVGQIMIGFDQDHKGGVWQYTLPNGAIITLHWTPFDPTKPISGTNKVIYNLIADGGLSGAPDPYPDRPNLFNEYTRDYRMNLLSQLLTQFKDPMEAITIFILTAYDGSFQSQESGYADATDRQTDLTNNYITPLTALLSECGNGLSNADANQVANYLFQSTAIIDSQHSSEGYADSYNKNFFNYFWSTQVTFKDNAGNTVTDSLMNIYQGCHDSSGNPITGKYSPGDFTKALNALNPQPTGGTPPSPSSPLQSILNALQQAGGLVTQQSKTLGTLSSSVANTDDQVLKVLGFATDSSSGGYAGLIKYLVEHQTT